MPTARQPAVAPSYWLVKSEPTSYSFDQLVQDGKTAWTGVRNYQARNNLAAMKRGDEVLVYHSVIGKEVVGLAKVERVAYPDPTVEEGSWQAVDLVPVRRLKRPVTLAEIKADEGLREIALLRQSRISVVPLRPAEFARIIKLSTTSAT
jgi:predicted RNA-binding protein with PUA-like domain